MPGDTSYNVARAMIGADQFARHDPGVEWPSERYADPVDAIIVAFEELRELTEELYGALVDARPFVFQRIYPVGHPARDWRSENAETILAVIDAAIATRAAG